MDLADLKKVNFISLGCAKNLVDSEVILGRLAQAGWAVCESGEDSDVVVVNTCGFLAESKAESVDAVRKAIELRDAGRIRGVVVAGCLPQRDASEVGLLLPEADAILGVDSREHIVDVCDQILAEKRPGTRVTAGSPRAEADRDRLRLTPRHFAYVRTSEGCDHTCAFCVIPQIKGRFRSKPVEVVVGEVRELARDGAKEICLIAQDTTSYGLDLYRRLELPRLLDAVSAVDGVEWIRLLYAYPVHVTDRLVRAIAGNPKVVKYLDLPLQHTTDRILRLMRRGTTKARQEELIRRLRDAVPDLVIRTTMIVGFPGEREEDFEELCADVERLEFERMGVFKFSREPGTRAATMPGEVGPDVLQQRQDRLMRLQKRVARRTNRRFVGRTVPAIVEGRDVGRTYADAPDVDGTIRLKGNGLKVGTIVNARVTAAHGYDLEGVVVSGS